MLYAYYIEIDLEVDKHMSITAMQGQLVMVAHLHVKSVFMKIYSSLSSRKCAFERPTEDLGIDSILVLLVAHTRGIFLLNSIP